MTNDITKHNFQPWDTVLRTRRPDRTISRSATSCLPLCTAAATLPDVSADHRTPSRSPVWAPCTNNGPQSPVSARQRWHKAQILR